MKLEYRYGQVYYTDLHPGDIISITNGNYKVLTENDIDENGNLKQPLQQISNNLLNKNRNDITQAEMICKLMELGYSALDSKEALRLTNFNFEEAKELLYLYTISNMHITYELLKLIKRIEKLERDMEK